MSYKNPGIERAMAQLAANRAAHPAQAERKAFASGRGGKVSIPFEAAATNGMVPWFPDLGPMDSVQYLRTLQRIGRHLVRNNPWFQGLHRVIRMVYGNTGPTPISRHSELVDLWHMSSGQFDSRGPLGHAHGSWVREDVIGNLFQDGEMFARFELDPVNFDGKRVPIAVTSLSSDLCPVEKTCSEPDGSRTIAGINLVRQGVRTVPRFYYMHQVHPRDALQWGVSGTLVKIPAREICHVKLTGMTGAVRGYVILAAALIRAIKLQQYEDAELRRKISSTLLSIFIERPLGDLADDSLYPSNKLIDELLSLVHLAPGAVHELPAGYKANSVSPPEATGYGTGVLMSILSICAGVGIPPGEVMGHIDGQNERVMRFGATAMKTQASIVRGDVEHALLDRQWQFFVDAAFAFGLWKPGAGQDLQQAYRVEWQWPIVQSAAITQELGVMSRLAETGHIPPGYIAQAYFGMRPEHAARAEAEFYARRAALGLKEGREHWSPDTDIAQRIGTTVAGEESRERDLVDAAITGIPAIDDWTPGDADF